MHATDQYTEPIRLGSRVEIRYLADGTRKEIRIAPVDQFDPLRGQLSERSPLGRALLGKRGGETVRLHAPKGIFEILVERVDNSYTDGEGSDPP
ncbi:MAG TPA: GreA/GreB family elongation factor [Fibrobacteria bacterium]|nr:GreA/GreB family elongation factor [Fibrobacteria bacterium]HOX52848.1 GreA/GreB family elongation factor [Fibrobacteria bacterium]